MALAPDLRAAMALPAICAAETLGSDLVYTDRITGVPANWLAPPLPRHGLDPADLPASPSPRRHDHLPEGVRPWRELWNAGQGIETIRDMPDVAELVVRLRRDYVAACAMPDWRDRATRTGSSL